MSDMLVKLYDLPAVAPPSDASLTIRKPMGAESRIVVDWVLRQFGDGWAAEAQQAINNRPCSLFLALRASTLLGFACYDATALGLFGPIGVDASARQQGLGANLLLACLNDMRSRGYAYAVIGAAGPAEFFRRTVNAAEIPGSSPGFYRGMLKTGAPVKPP